MMNEEKLDRVLAGAFVSSFCILPSAFS